MEEIIIGTFPHNQGGDCLQDVAIKVNKNFEEVYEYISDIESSLIDPDDPSLIGTGKIKIIRLLNEHTVSDEGRIVIENFLQDVKEDKVNYILAVNYLGGINPINLIRYTSKVITFEFLIMSKYKVIGYLLDIYLNYDGSFGSINLFQRELDQKKELTVDLDNNVINIDEWKIFASATSNNKSNSSKFIIKSGNTYNLILSFTNNGSQSADYIIFQQGLILYRIDFPQGMQFDITSYTISKLDLTLFEDELKSLEDKITQKIDDVISGNLEDINKKLENKVDKEVGKGLSSNDFTDEDKILLGNIVNKVDKVTGKGLSSNDFTDEYREILDTLQDVVIEVNRMSKEQASLPSKILTNIQPAQLEALKKDKVGLDLTFDVGNIEDKTQIYLDGATQDTAGILTAEDKKVIDSVADLKLGYNEETRMIQLNNGTELVSEIPADRFIKDGMVNGVSIDEETKVVTITFNTDAGQEDIPVDFGDIYDLLLGEAKSYVDNKIFLQVGLENGKYPGGQIAYIQHPDTSTIRLIPTWKDHFNSFIFNVDGEIEFNDGNGPNSSSIITIKNTDKVNNSYNLKDYLDLKANQATTYTKEEVNDLISSKANSATTLAGYGITDAKIENRTITLGSNSIEIPESPIVLTISSTANESNVAAYTKLLSNLTISTYIVDNDIYYRSVLNSVINSTTIRVFVIVNAATSNPSLREYQLYSNGSLTQSIDTVLITSKQLKSTLTYTTEANADNVSVWNNYLNNYISGLQVYDTSLYYPIHEINRATNTIYAQTIALDPNELRFVAYTITPTTGAMTKTTTSYQLTPVTA